MSTAKQDLSPDQQRAAVAKYAADHGHEIVAEYSDLGRSGTSVAKRVGFQQMHADALAGKFDVILCFDRSRFGRLDAIDSGRWIAPLRDAGVSLETVAEGAADWCSFAGRVADAVLAEVKHQASVDIARATTRGLTAKALAGRGHAGGIAPFGYRRVTIVEGRLRTSTLEIHEPAAAVVRRMFALYASPAGSLMAVVRDLQAAGVACPNGGREWRRNTVVRILTNPAYRGDAVWGRRATGKFFTRDASGGLVARRPKAPPSAAVAIEHRDAVPAIVDRELFEKVQGLVAERQKVTRSPAKTNALSGLVVCAQCGLPMHADGAGGMRCQASHAGKACSSARVAVGPLLAAVAAGLQERLTPDALAKMEATMREAAGKRPGASPEAVKATLEARIRRLDGEVSAGASRLLEVPAALVKDVTAAIAAKAAERDRLAAELAGLAGRRAGPQQDHVTRLMAALRDVGRLLAAMEPAAANAALRAVGVRIEATPASTRKRRRPGSRERAVRPQNHAVVVIGGRIPTGRLLGQVPGETHDVPLLSFAVAF